jgi:hypothetical protein
MHCRGSKSRFRANELPLENHRMRKSLAVSCIALLCLARIKQGGAAQVYWGAAGPMASPAWPRPLAEPLADRHHSIVRYSAPQFSPGPGERFTGPLPRAATPERLRQLTPAASPAEVDADLANQILALLGETVINRLSAEVTLEGLTVEETRVRLQGVTLRNLDLGLQLNARGSRRLIDILGSRAATTTRERQMLEILKLGLFNKIGFNLRLRELRVGKLEVDADALDAGGLSVGAELGPAPGEDATTKASTIKALIAFLTRTAPNRIEAHVALEELAAKRLRLKLEQLSLEGLHIGIELERRETAS